MVANFLEAANHNGDGRKKDLIIRALFSELTDEWLNCIGMII